MVKLNRMFLKFNYVDFFSIYIIFWSFESLLDKQSFKLKTNKKHETIIVYFH